MPLLPYLVPLDPHGPALPLLRGRPMKRRTRAEVRAIGEASALRREQRREQERQREQETLRCSDPATLWQIDSARLRSLAGLGGAA